MFKWLQPVGQVTKQPTKVRIEGVPPGSDLAAALVGRFRPEINHYQRSQHQKAALSGLAVYGAHIELPDLRMRYTSHYGNDRLDISISPRVIVEELEKMPRKKPLVEWVLLHWYAASSTGLVDLKMRFGQIDDTVRPFPEFRGDRAEERVNPLSVSYAPEVFVTSSYMFRHSILLSFDYSREEVVSLPVYGGRSYTLLYDSPGAPGGDTQVGDLSTSMEVRIAYATYDEPPPLIRNGRSERYVGPVAGGYIGWTLTQPTGSSPTDELPQTAGNLSLADAGGLPFLTGYTTSPVGTPKAATQLGTMTIDRAARDVSFGR